MGQYQEWLLAQELGNRLQVELEALETQISYLKERVSSLEQAAPETENVILQALLARQVSMQTPLPETEQVSEPAPVEPIIAATPPVESADEPLPSVPTPSLALPDAPALPASVPTDMRAFFEEQSKTDPGFAAWQQYEQNLEQLEHPVDAETRRLNENVQRWFERWHREMTSRVRAEARDGQ
jgi:DNA primase